MKEPLNTVVVVVDLMVGGTQEWRNVSNMCTRREGVRLVAINGRLYAVGCWNGRTIVISGVLRFCLQSWVIGFN